MSADNIADMTPEELQAPLLTAMKAHIPFDGWTVRALNAAAADIGVSPEMAELAFPSGPNEVLSLYLSTADNALQTAIDALDLPALKIRDQITLLIRTRLEQNIDDRELVRRTLATLALPQNAALGLKALWKTSDIMWRAAGDTSTDHNWYTKRMTLSGVYSSVLVYWLSDESDNFQDTWDFLDRRIADVMKIETAKYKLRESTSHMPSLARFLGRLRYPV